MDIRMMNTQKKSAIAQKLKKIWIFTKVKWEK